MNEAKEKAGRPTAEQIAEWKAKHGTLHMITSEDGEFQAIIRKPKLHDLERAMKADKAPKAKPLDFNRSILQNCLLYEDPGFRSDDEREVGLLTGVGEVVAIAEVTVKKL